MIPILISNSEDSNQMSRFAASDLGLHYLPLSLFSDARLKRVKKYNKEHERNEHSMVRSLRCPNITLSVL